MTDMQARLQAQINETTTAIIEALTDFGLNVIRVEPCEDPEPEDGELLPHFSGGHFNGWFQISSKEGNFKIGFVAEGIPVMYLLGTGVTVKDIIEGMPKEEQPDFDDDTDFNDFIPFDERVLEIFIGLLKNRQPQ